MRLDRGKLLINYCIVNFLAVDQCHAGIFSAAPRMAIAFVLNPFNSPDGGETFFDRSNLLCRVNRMGRLNVELNAQILSL